MEVAEVATQERGRPIRIGVASAGRFHLLDLARELHELSFDVKFYSYVPRKRAEAFGLPKERQRSLLPFVALLVGLERVFPRLFSRYVERLMYAALDNIMMWRLEPCDVFICMSGFYVKTLQTAKSKYGAKIIVHRGSQHILSQKKILDQVPGARSVSSYVLKRELESYCLADCIEVPSSHVMESFLVWSEHAPKMALNHYGVDLRHFPLQKGFDGPQATILFVGVWSREKGVDILVSAIETMNDVHLVHVGGIGDIAFPSGEKFKHYDPVPQAELAKFYASAHVFALASRQDGFGMVLSQALASGLPVVCTDKTGGPDLARSEGLARLIRVVPAGSAAELGVALKLALFDARESRTFRRITQKERDSLTWRNYALREVGVIERMSQKTFNSENSHVAKEAQLS
jgi:starch synthase